MTTFPPPIKSPLLTISLDAPDSAPYITQPITAPLSRTSIFLTVTLNSAPQTHQLIRSFCADLSGIIRAVEFRNMDAQLSCITSFGSAAWDQLFGAPRPAELHPFREIHSAPRHAISTPADILFHIRARHMDMCFELATQIMARIATAVSPADEVHGFRISTIATSSVSSTAPKTPAARPSPRPFNERPYVLMHGQTLPSWHRLRCDKFPKRTGSSRLSPSLKNVY